MRVQVRGVTYDSVEEAAEALGVKPVAVYSAVCRGRLDYLGMGPGRTRKPETTAKARGKPVTIGGTTWRSMSALSVWLGREPKYAAQLIRRGNYEILLGRVMARMSELSSRGDCT